MPEVLMLGLPELDTLIKLRTLAIDHPFDVRDILDRVRTPEGLAAHHDALRSHTAAIQGYTVTYTVENHHPAGTCRHLSVARISGGDRAPPAGVVWAVARTLGFALPAHTCRTWPETAADGRTATNLVQPLRFPPGHPDHQG